MIGKAGKVLGGRFLSLFRICLLVIWRINRKRGRQMINSVSMKLQLREMMMIDNLHLPFISVSRNNPSHRLA